MHFYNDIIQNDPLIREKIDPIFEKIYSANKLGITKRDSESYQFIAKDLGVKPEEIFFTDDTVGNIDAAREAGVKIHLFVSNTELINTLRSLSSAYGIIHPISSKKLPNQIKDFISLPIWTLSKKSGYKLRIFLLKVAHRGVEPLILP